MCIGDLEESLVGLWIIPYTYASNCLTFCLGSFLFTIFSPLYVCYREHGEKISVLWFALVEDFVWGGHYSITFEGCVIMDLDCLLNGKKTELRREEI